MKRIIVDARADKEGDISHVKFKGNVNFTPVATAIPMAERGEIDGTHVVNRPGAKKHLRSNPDGKKANNLDNMAGDS